jgi:hypothetical protein
VKLASSPERHISLIFWGLQPHRSASVCGEKGFALPITQPFVS